MTIKQLSIFIENKSGTLIRVLDLLSKANIQIIASTIADTKDYGIYRVLCDQPTQAYLLLRENGINVQLADVFALSIDDTPGQAAEAVRLLSSEGVGILYMYSFLSTCILSFGRVKVCLSCVPIQARRQKRL